MEHGDSIPQSAEREALPGYSASKTALSRIRLRHLTCFVVVAQERTLARAAARLHLSQPAVSKTLAELEDLAGRRLVERGRAGTQLTPAGEQFLRYAVEVTQALESAAAVLTGAAVPIAPTVRVAALPTVAGGLLVQALARLHERRPHPASACGSAITRNCSRG
jgi:DNA-binding transcriptional LysR family regulator